MEFSVQLEAPIRIWFSRLQSVKIFHYIELNTLNSQNSKKKLVCLLFSLASLFFFGSTGNATHLPTLDPEALSDWVSEPASISLCEGHYVQFTTDKAQTNDSWQLPIVVFANETEFTLQGQSLLHGNVILKQGPRYLHADEVMIERSTDKKSWEHLVATGHIHYFAPGIRVWGKEAHYYQSQKHFHMDEAYYRWYARHARGYAKSININQEAIYLHEANYTTCAPSSQTWLLNAKEIALYPKKGRAIAKHFWLNLYNVPIFYFPYFNYPIDKRRHSGFLFPSYGSSSNSGYEITIPYYWNIAPNYDFIIQGRWLTERGLETQSKFRYLFPKSEGVIQWHFLPYDRKYALFQEDNLETVPEGLSPLDPRIIALEGSHTRHAFNYRHSTQVNAKTQFNVIFDYVSDDNYFVDLGNDLHTASVIQLPQQANITYYSENWSHYVNIEEYQVLQPLSKPINEEIYKRQPQWVYQAIYPNQSLGLTYGLNGEMVNFAHLPALISQEPVTTGQRYHLRPSISLPLQESWFFLTPRIQVDWLQYSLSLSEENASQNFPAHPNRSIPMYDLDAGLFFERNIHFKQFENIQTFEPRIYYLYVPFRNQHLYPDFDSGVINFSYAQLFRDNRFSGRDRVGDANQISVSLMTRFLPKEGHKEWLKASIGQIFYFSHRRVLLCEAFDEEMTCPQFEDTAATAPHSDLLGQIDLHIAPAWSGGLFWEWDSINQVTEQAAISLQYQPSHHKVINFNYYWLKHDLAQTDFATGTTGSLNQAEISLLWPMNLHWELLSVWRYNFQQKQTVEILAGLEYNGCCMALQIVGSRYRQSNNYFYPQAYATGVFAQIVFKGLSAIGLNNPDGRLKQKIPGYIPLKNRQQWLVTPEKNYFPPEEIPLY